MRRAAAVLPANHPAPPYLATQSQKSICATNSAIQDPVGIGDGPARLRPAGGEADQRAAVVMPDDLRRFHVAGGATSLEHVFQVPARDVEERSAHSRAVD